MVKARRAAIFLAFLVLFASIASGYSAGFAQLENVRTGAVSPGETFTVNFQVHNTLNDRLKYVVVRAQGSQNFRVVGGDSWSSGGEIERNGIVSGSLTFQADPDLVAGVYSIPLTLTSESKTLSGASFSGSVVNSLQTLSASESVSVEIAGTPALLLSLKESAPRFVEAGKEATLSFELSNYGNEYARDVSVSIGKAENSDIGPARKIFLGDIAPNGKGSFSVPVLPDKGITAIDLPVEAEFSGEGKASWTVSVPLELTADLEASEYASAFAVAGENEETISFVLKNVGRDSAQNIRVSLMTEYPITPSGRSALVERLGPGEEARVDFTVDVDSKAAERKYPVQLGVSFEENSERKSDILDAQFSVKKTPGRAPYFIGGAAMLLVAVLVFKKLKGNKKGDKR